MTKTITMNFIVATAFMCTRCTVVLCYLFVCVGLFCVFNRISMQYM